MANSRPLRGRIPQARYSDYGFNPCSAETASVRRPAMMCAIADAVRWAEESLNEIDERWPVERNRETVFQRLLGEPNHFTIGAQGNSPEPAVGAVVRELLGQMMWFVDVSALAFIKVGSTLSEEYKARVLAYRYRDLMRAKIFRVEIVEHDFVENTGIIRGIDKSAMGTSALPPYAGVSAGSDTWS